MKTDPVTYDNSEKIEITTNRKKRSLEKGKKNKK